MVNINEEFPSKYLKSSDLQGSVANVKIDRVTVEQIGDDRKLVMYFVGKSKGMVLNKTNARTIGDVYGEDTDEWIEKPIEVFSMKVDFQGRMVDGLRIRVPAPRKQAIAPNARERAAATVGRGEDPLDDEIPFAPEWRG
jgi:hypothetical protein